MRPFALDAEVFWNLNTKLRWAGNGVWDVWCAVQCVQKKNWSGSEILRFLEWNFSADNPIFQIEVVGPNCWTHCTCDEELCVHGRGFKLTPDGRPLCNKHYDEEKERGFDKEICQKCMKIVNPEEKLQKCRWKSGEGKCMKIVKIPRNKCFWPKNKKIQLLSRIFVTFIEFFGHFLKATFPPNRSSFCLTHLRRRLPRIPLQMSLLQRRTNRNGKRTKIWTLLPALPRQTRINSHLQSLLPAHRRPPDLRTILLQGDFAEIWYSRRYLVSESKKVILGNFLVEKGHFRPFLVKNVIDNHEFTCHFLRNFRHISTNHPVLSRWTFCLSNLPKTFSRKAALRTPRRSLLRETLPRGCRTKMFRLYGHNHWGSRQSVGQALAWRVFSLWKLWCSVTGERAVC